MNNGCLDCAEKDKAKNKQFTILKEQAKIKAIESQKTKAICEDQITGLFICEAEVAIREHFLIRDIISYL
jgi:hypothetical protein